MCLAKNWGLWPSFIGLHNANPWNQIVVSLVKRMNGFVKVNGHLPNERVENTQIVAEMKPSID